MKMGSAIGNAVRSLRRSLSPSRRRTVPEDVKEGQFAVVAVWGAPGEEEPRSKRFVVSLSCLSNPVFLRLLQQAEEAFGLRQEGAIAVPCTPCELERIIGEL